MGGAERARGLRVSFGATLQLSSKRTLQFSAGAGLPSLCFFGACNNPEAFSYDDATRPPIESGFTMISGRYFSRLPNVLGQRHSALLGVLVCCLLSPGLAAQEVACESQPHPDAPAELEQFHFLIGQFDILGSQWNGEEWGPRGRPSYWEGEYILGGVAIADYYYNQPPELDAPGRGVNIRMYDPDTGIWTMSWSHTSNPGSVRLLEAEEIDGTMWMYQMDDPETRFSGRKTSFHIVDENHWYRVDEFSDDGGKTWRKTLRLEATRRACS